MTQSTPKAKRGKDSTRTDRAKAHLDRIMADQGKRVVVDFDGEHRSMLDALVKAGFADSQSEVLRRAVREAHKKMTPKA